MAFRTEDDHVRIITSSSRLAFDLHSAVMPGLDPGIHHLRKGVSEEDGLPGQARQ